MRIIMAVISKSGKLELENIAVLSLLVHTLLWFVLGGCAGKIVAFCMHLSAKMQVSYIVTIGSVCALIFGYICGMVYLLRREA